MKPLMDEVAPRENVTVMEKGRGPARTEANIDGSAPLTAEDNELKRSEIQSVCIALITISRYYWDLSVPVW
ncbi:unnamed protein product [Pleuronectes platessa]|uniref:Uncharacterized protein n=1 Tax=Pleuronectes platessa TaxID=8262 RepID=A0A9N7U255_PLEPL|nr:unnamed protein product [Pleuronectes platessa]